MFSKNNWLIDTLDELKSFQEKNSSTQAQEYKQGLIRQGVREWQQCKKKGEALNCPEAYIDFLMGIFAEVIETEKYTELHRAFGLIPDRVNKKFEKSEINFVALYYLQGFLTGTAYRFISNNDEIRKAKMELDRVTDERYDKARRLGVDHGVKEKKLCAARLKEAFHHALNLSDENVKKYYQSSRDSLKELLCTHSQLKDHMKKIYQGSSNTEEFLNQLKYDERFKNMRTNFEFSFNVE